MPVTDFECQIVRGQIGRYLDGDSLAPGILKGLEEHLGECSECKAIVAQRRAALVESLNGSVPTHAVVSMPKKVAENPLLTALKKRAAASEVEEKETKPVAKTRSAPRYAGAKTKMEADPRITVPAASKPFGKPIFLGAILSVVLIGMSAMSRSNNGNGVLGTKASTAFAAETIPDAPKPVKAEKKPEAPKLIILKAEVPKVEIPKTEVREVEAPKVEKAKTEPVKPKVEVPKTVVEKPVVKPTVKPVQVKPIAQASVKPAARKHRSYRRRSSSGNGSVRIYAPDGQVLK